MNLWITQTVLTSDVTGHHARPVEGGWELSWLPGRVLDRHQAITGMVLAESAADQPRPTDRRWPLINALAAELALSGSEAIASATSAADRADPVREPAVTEQAPAEATEDTDTWGDG